MTAEERQRRKERRKSMPIRPPSTTVLTSSIEKDTIIVGAAGDIVQQRRGSITNTNTNGIGNIIAVVSDDTVDNWRSLAKSTPNLAAAMTTMNDDDNASNQHRVYSREMMLMLAKQRSAMHIDRDQLMAMTKSVPDIMRTVC